MVAIAKRPQDCEQINRLEEAIAQGPLAQIPTLHLFPPRMYVRTVLMKAGTVWTSRIHKTEHPFVVSLGCCTVVDGEGERIVIQAPHLGVTKPGTRRALMIHEDMIWTTFHATNLNSVEEIEAEILEPLEGAVQIKGQHCIMDIGSKHRAMEARLQ